MTREADTILGDKGSWSLKSHKSILNFQGEGDYKEHEPWLNTVGSLGVVPGGQLWKARAVTHTLALALWGPWVWLHWCGC